MTDNITILNSDIILSEVVVRRLSYPIVVINNIVQGEQISDEMTKQDWCPVGYNRASDIQLLEKELDIGDIVTGIRVNFSKESDEKDNQLGICQTRALGSMFYELNDEDKKIAGRLKFHGIKNNMGIDYRKELKVLVSKYARNIIQDEYEELVRFDEELRTAVMNAIQPGIDDSVQQQLIMNAFRSVSKENPSRRSQRADMIMKNVLNDVHVAIGR